MSGISISSREIVFCLYKKIPDRTNRLHVEALVEHQKYNLFLKSENSKIQNKKQEKFNSDVGMNWKCSLFWATNNDYCQPGSSFLADRTKWGLHPKGLRLIQALHHLEKFNSISGKNIWDLHSTDINLSFLLVYMDFYSRFSIYFSALHKDIKKCRIQNINAKQKNKMMRSNFACDDDWKEWKQR